MKFRLLKYRFIFLLLLIAYLCLHLVTLTSFPLPWYDETYMAAIGKAFLETGRFTKTVAFYTDIPTEDLRYGPFYYFFVAFFFKFFGFGIFQYRLIAFLSGLWTFWLTFKIFATEHKNYFTTWCLLALLAIDSFYFRCMHEGRMDLLASGLMLTAHLAILKIFKTDDAKEILKNMVLAGALASLSLLTSPRLGFALPGIALFLFIHFLTKKPKLLLRALLSFLVPFVALYSIWIFYAFGGYVEFVTFYIENLGYTRLNGYPYYFPRQQLPLLLILGISVIAGVYLKKKSYFSPLAILALINIISYYIIVYDNGPYASLIYPYIYILIFKNFEGGFWEKAENEVFVKGVG